MKKNKTLLLTLLLSLLTPKLVFADQLEALGEGLRMIMIGIIVLLVLFLIGVFAAIKYYKTKSKTAFISTIAIIVVMLLPIGLYLSNDGEMYDFIFKLGWLAGLILTLIAMLHQRVIKENPTKMLHYIINLFLWMCVVSYLTFQFFPFQRSYIVPLIFPVCIFFYSRRMIAAKPNIGFRKLWNSMAIISMSTMALKFLMPLLGTFWLVPIDSSLSFFLVSNFYLTILIQIVLCLILITIASGIQFKLSQNRTEE